MFSFFKRNKVRAVELNEQNFNEAIQSKKVVFVYFETTTCNACRMLHPILHQLAQENKEKDVCISVVNAEKERKLSLFFNVMSVPTLIVFVQGKKVFQGSGMISKPRTQELIDYYLSLSD